LLFFRTKWDRPEPGDLDVLASLANPPGRLTADQSTEKENPHKI
jgi:hypothetical protein